MWLSLVSGCVSLFNKFLSVWSEYKLRQAGRNEVSLEMANKELKDMEIADEIEMAPSPGRDELLKRLRRQSAAK
jgi:hypothetical protein